MEDVCPKMLWKGNVPRKKSCGRRRFLEKAVDCGSTTAVCAVAHPKALDGWPHNSTGLDQLPLVSSPTLGDTSRPEGISVEEPCLILTEVLPVFVCLV